VAEHKSADRMAALEQARAQIEIALSANEDWLAFRQAGSSRLLHERALAGNPLYRSWDLLNEAIQELHAKGAQQSEVQTSTAHDDLTRIRGIGPALARRLADRGITTFGQIAAWRPDDVHDVAEALGLGRGISRQNWIEQAALLEHRRHAAKTEVAAPATAPVAEAAPTAQNARDLAARDAAQGIDLHHVLQHIRNDAAVRGSGLPTTSRDRVDGARNAALTADVELPVHAGAPDYATRERWPEPPEGLDGPSRTGGVEETEPEDATVTFVIREPVQTASGGEHSTEHDKHGGPPLSDRAASSYTREEAFQVSPNNKAEEAEVVIVSRPADRPSATVRRQLKS